MGAKPLPDQQVKCLWCCKKELGTGVVLKKCGPPTSAKTLHHSQHGKAPLIFCSLFVLHVSPLQDAALGAKGISENSGEEAGGESGGLGSDLELHHVIAGLPGWRLYAVCLRKRCGRPHMVNTDACVVGSMIKLSLGAIFVSFFFFSEDL